VLFVAAWFEVSSGPVENLGDQNVVKWDEIFLQLENARRFKPLFNIFVNMSFFQLLLWLRVV